MYIYYIIRKYYNITYEKQIIKNNYLVKYFIVIYYVKIYSIFLKKALPFTYT